MAPTARTKNNVSRTTIRKAAKPRPRRIGRPAQSNNNAVGRDALIAKTCELLSTMPPSAVTRAAVARAMRVDPSLIRYYFKDRSTLLLAAFDRLSVQLSQFIETAVKPAESSAALRLRTLSHALLKLESTFPFYQRLILEEIVPMQTPAARKSLQLLLQRVMNMLDQLVDDGVKDSSLRRTDPLCLWIAMLGMCQFFVASAPLRATLQKRSEKTFGERYRHFVGEMLLNGCSTERR